MGGNMNLEDELRYLIGGYFGVELVDEYLTKEYVLKDIDDFIKGYIEANDLKTFDLEKEKEKIRRTVSDKTKLQDALLTLNRMNGPMDLILIINRRLKKYNSK